MFKEDPFHTGAKLRQLREFHNLTQEWVAGKLGVAKNTLSDYERGKVPPGQALIFRAAMLFNVDPGIFFSSARLSIGLQSNTRTDGQFAVLPGEGQELVDRLFAHINERDKRMEEILAKAIEKFGRNRRS